MSENNTTYVKCGEYLLPKLSVPESPQIGVWGERRRKYLREHQHAIYTGMLLNDKLNTHLEEIDRQAETMFSQLVKQFSNSEGVTEGAKAENQMLWVQRMNNIRSRAAEIICAELIYA